MAAQIPSFFKVVLQHNINSSKLKLPAKFTTEHSWELSDVVQLVVSDGRIWKLGLTREGDDVFLSDGFREFARHYSLSFGHLLVFKYKGLSCFSVAIYDNSNCQISHSSNHPNSASAPGNFRSKRTNFEIKLTKYNLDRHLVYIPTKASRKMRRAKMESDLIWLEIGDAKRWEVSLMNDNGERFRLGKLKAFFEDNRLKENDTCLFEVVKNNLLKVIIFAAI